MDEDTRAPSVKVMVSVEHAPGADRRGAGPDLRREAARECLVIFLGENAPELSAAVTAAFIRDACRGQSGLTAGQRGLT